MTSLESFLVAVSIIIFVASAVVGFIILVKWVCERYTPKATGNPKIELKAGECGHCGHICGNSYREVDAATGVSYKDAWWVGWDRIEVDFYKHTCSNCGSKLDYSWSYQYDVEIPPKLIDPSNIITVFVKTNKGIHREYREVISNSSDLRDTEMLTIPCTSEDTYPYEED